MLLEKSLLELTLLDRAWGQKGHSAPREQTALAASGRGRRDQGRETASERELEVGSSSGT